MSIESRRILLRHARCGEDVQYDEKTEEAIKHLLVICAGLPVAHGVIGKLVAEHSLNCAMGMEEAWKSYSRTDESIVASVDNEYGSLKQYVHNSIASNGEGEERYANRHKNRNRDSQNENT